MPFTPPETMKAVCFDAPGGADVLCLRQLEPPSAQAGEVLIDVAFAGVNRPDVLQRSGLYPPPPDANPRLGLEVSGKVVSLGEGVCADWLGVDVMALCNGGGYSEFVTVPVGQCIKVPSGITMAEAASLPEVYFTVWQNLVLKASLTSSQHVLIHGGSSGIGSAAIQLAKCIGATVHVTVGNEEKAAFCRSLGADFVYNYKLVDWSQLAKANTPDGVDVILDMVAGDYLNRNLQCVAQSGKVIVIALLGGRYGQIDAAQLMMKQAVLTGTTLRPRSAEFKAQIASELALFMQECLATGKIRPVVEKVFPIDDVRSAHQWLESGSGFGKVVLQVK